MTVLKIAALQMDIVWENRRENHTKAAEYARKAKEQGANLFVLPEMFATGFSMDPSVTAEDPKGETPEFLKGLAAEQEMAVIGGYVQQRRGDKGANAALSVDSRGRVLSEYFKTHLFTHLDEHLAHEAGAGPRPFELDGAEIACFICYDLRFPELFRLVCDNAKVVCVIASWPASRQHHWDALLKARAIENQVFVVGVNRVGVGGGLEFTGGTTVIDPLGRTVAAAGQGEELVVAPVDTSLVARVREQFPFLKDRRF